MRYLVDTNICSAQMKNARGVASRFIQHASSIAISAVTLGELASWVLRSKTSPRHLETLYEFLKDVEILPVDSDVGWKCAELNSVLLDRGQPPPEMDLLIAATAIVHNLTLVTHNVRDFQNIAGLTIIDWLDP